MCPALNPRQRSPELFPVYTFGVALFEQVRLVLRLLQ